MKLLERPKRGDRRPDDIPAGETSSRRPASTATWTAGRALGSYLLSIFLVALIVVGAVSGLAAFARTLAPVQAETSGVEGLEPRQQEAAAFAGTYTAAWLTATRSEPGLLADFVDEATLTSLGATATEYRQLQVASVTEISETLVAVEVTAWLQEMDLAADVEEPMQAWRLRAFALTIDTSGDVLAPVGLPSPVQPPAGQMLAPANYDVAIDGTSAVGTAVTEFLAAYAAGIGDVDRYVSPDFAVDPITPPIATDVSVASILATAEAPEEPGIGNDLSVYATATLVTADGRETPTTYLLTLTSRDSRWEVSSIDLTPAPPIES